MDHSRPVSAGYLKRNASTFSFGPSVDAGAAAVTTASTAKGGLKRVDARAAKTADIFGMDERLADLACRGSTVGLRGAAAARSGSIYAQPTPPAPRSPVRETVGALLGSPARPPTAGAAAGAGGAAAAAAEPPSSPAVGISTNSYASGNHNVFITDRRMTRVTSPPGGRSTWSPRHD